MKITVYCKRSRKKGFYFKTLMKIFLIISILNENISYYYLKMFKLSTVTLHIH